MRLEADFSDALFFFFFGGGKESPAEESLATGCREGAEPGVNFLEGVGADWETATIDADASAVDVAGDIGGRAERADSIKAVRSLAARAFRVLAEKRRQ